MPDFVDALLTEARWRLDRHKGDAYLGGGTPSLLSSRDLTALFEGLQKLIDFSSCDEISFEANPKTFNLEKANLFKSLGVTRVSLGVQSFKPHVLKILGRDHSPQEALQAYQLLRDADISQVNIDLMFSIPGLSIGDWEDTLKQAVDLKPDHLSAYNLTYEEDTPFLEALAEGRLDECEDRNADQFKLADDYLTEEGFEHYETSNYAQPGMHSIHNRGYWAGEDYLGLGPSAVATMNGIRTTNIADTAAYLKRIASLGHAIENEEVIDNDASHLERIALLMRTSAGVPLQLFKPTELANAQKLIEENLLKKEDDHIKATGHGRLLVDELVAYIV